MRRNFLKIIGSYFIGFMVYPFSSAIANNLIGYNSKLNKDESEYNIINPDLTDEQKKIMFDQATEKSGSSILNKEKREGTYHCANCGLKLFESTAKFDSGTGWPSFTEAIPGVFKTKIDYSFGMKRTEYHCANCGAHHGHVFNDGPNGGKRYCNNGLCLLFIPTT